MRSSIWKVAAGAAGVLSLVLATACETTENEQALEDSPRPVVREQPVAQAEPTPPPTAPAETPAVARAAPQWWPTMKNDRSMRWTSMCFPTGDPLTSVIGIEKGMPKEIRLNQNFNYRILVTNLTANKLESVVLYEDFGQHLEYYASTPSASTGGGRISWMLGTMNPRETRNVVVTAKPAAEGTVGACASVTYASAFCAEVAVVSPKLKIVKSGPAEVVRCDEIVYNIEVSNVGTGAINNVRVIDSLPKGMTTIEGRNVFEAAVGTLEAGQSMRYSFRAQAESKGKFENRAVATGDGDLTAESALVSVLAREPALEIKMTGPKESFIAVPVTYEITVTNKGDTAATDTVLESATPTGAALVNASNGAAAVGGKVVWKLGTIATGASKKVSMTLRGDQPVSLRSVVTAKAYCAPAVTASADTVVRGIPAILLEVVDLSDPIRVGDNVAYQITVTNQGSATDHNIRLICTLEENQQFVSVSGATGGSAEANVITLAPLAQLAPKARAVWTVTVKNVTPGDVRFKVTMRSDNITRPVEETEATNVWR